MAEPYSDFTKSMFFVLRKPAKAGKCFASPHMCLSITTSLPYMSGCKIALLSPLSAIYC